MNKALSFIMVIMIEISCNASTNNNNNNNNNNNKTLFAVGDSFSQGLFSLEAL